MLAGGFFVRWTTLVTMQSGQAFRSPTAVDTTGVNPALLIAEDASLYFCPVTFGIDAAVALALPSRASTAAAAPPPSATHARNRNLRTAPPLPSNLPAI